ncbi:Heat shock transcription factor [Trachipleistophora hominis]|uniref:Heat shock transcription factor n=1 Tax=Trachipleistophora hominis TaxID=72359 RepID=L7K0E0_TRAHO|nr:Heat shock transcription factor [Trachipleistophora hominis]
MSSSSSFINHLFTILETPTNHPYIRWSSTGKSIIIPNQHMFTLYVLTKYFNHDNFSSFVRQLNKYGFRKVKNTLNNVHEFRQEHFMKEKPFLSRWIRRRRGNEVKRRIEELWIKYNCLWREMSEIKEMMGMNTMRFRTGKNLDGVSGGEKKDDVVRNKKRIVMKKKELGNEKTNSCEAECGVVRKENADSNTMINEKMMRRVEGESTQEKYIIDCQWMNNKEIGNNTEKDDQSDEEKLYNDCRANMNETNACQRNTCEYVYRNFKKLGEAVYDGPSAKNDELSFTGADISFCYGKKTGMLNTSGNNYDKLESFFDSNRKYESVKTYDWAFEESFKEDQLRNRRENEDLTMKADNHIGITRNIFSVNQHKSLNGNTPAKKNVAVIENTEYDQMYITRFLSTLPIEITNDHLNADILIISDKSVDNYVLVKRYLENDKIVFLTLDSFDERRCYEYLRMGIKEVVIKPYCSDTLFALLEKYIEL